MPSRRPSPSLRIEELQEQLDTRLENPDLVLESLVASLARGGSDADQWERLHQAAERDGRQAELAFAYEQVTSDRRVRLLPADAQAQLLEHAALFLADRFGNVDGAITLAERALAAAPQRTGLLARLEQWLTAKGASARLARLLWLSGKSAPDDVRAICIARAVELCASDDREPSVALEVLESILAVEAHHPVALVLAAERQLAAGRPRDAARRWEARLSLEGLEPAQARALHERLLGLYQRELPDPLKAVAQAEALLTQDGGHAAALAAAESLANVPSVAARALGAMSDAYELAGDKPRAAALLTQELKVARGPRRVEVQRRLGRLRQDVLSDPAGAFELLGAVVTTEPGDDDTRRRYASLALSLDRAAEAARLLSRALQVAKDPGVRARASVELGCVFVRMGEVRRARSLFEDALRSKLDPQSNLTAASALVELYSESGESAGLANALEIVVRLESRTEERQTAARRLARLAETELGEPARAVPAWRALIDSPQGDESLQRLQQFFEQKGEISELAAVLAQRAARAADPIERRQLDLRATELWTRSITDRSERILLWRALIDRQGPLVEALDALLPLLEQDNRTFELAQVLEQRIQLATGSDASRFWARLGSLRARELDDRTGALGCYRKALLLDTSCRAARQEVEAMLTDPALGPDASELLEPLLRQEAPSLSLVSLLAARAELVTDLPSQLTALTEAVRIAESLLERPDIAFPLTVRGIVLVRYEASEQLGLWIERLRRVASAVEAQEKIQLLSPILESEPLAQRELLELAILLADSLADTGEHPRAITLLRRALELEPSAPELLGRLDELLATDATPEDRLALYGQALERESRPERQKELRVRIAQLTQRDLKDLAAAELAWRQVLEFDAAHHGAHQALCQLFTELQNEPALRAELDRALGVLSGERRLRALDRLVDVEVRLGDLRSALAHALAAHEAQPGQLERLAQVESLARGAGELAVVERVLGEKLRLSEEADKRAEVLEAIGAVRQELGEGLAASEAYAESARLHEQAGNHQGAAHLLQRAFAANPQDRSIASNLAELLGKLGNLADLGRTLASLRELGSDEREITRRVLEQESRATAGMAPLEFSELIESVLSTTTDPGRQRQLRLARARVLAKDESTQLLAAVAFRELLEGDVLPDSELLASFGSLLDSAPELPEWRSERRGWFEQRVRSSAEPETVLLEWARFERESYEDLVASEELVNRVLAREPERADAWTELLLLHRTRNDYVAAEVAIAALIPLIAPELRAPLIIERAQLLAGPLESPVRSLEVLEPLLIAEPGSSELLTIVRMALESPQSRPSAVALLERAASGVDDPSARADALRALLAVTGESLNFADERARWTLALADTFPDDPDAILGLTLRAATANPAALALWERAERAARSLGTPAAVLAGYEAAVVATKEPELAEELGHRWSDFHEEWADDPDSVIPLLERVLAACPAAEWAFDRLKLSFSGSGRWPELFDLYDRRLEGASAGAATVELLREAAMAAKDFASDPDRAIHYFRLLDGAEPNDTRVEAALERLYERQAQLRPLIDLLTRQAARASGAALYGLQLRVGGLWLDVEDPLPAFELVTLMSEAHGSDLAVISVLERLVALPAARESIVPTRTSGKGSDKRKRVRPLSVRDACALQLRRYYESTSQTADVVRMLEIEVELAIDDVERIERLRRIVEVRLRELDDAAGAFENVLTLIRLEPGAQELRTQLSELAQRVGGRSRQARVLEEVALTQLGTELAVQLTLEAGDVHRLHLDAADRAVTLYSTVLDSEFGTDHAKLAAARELDKLLETAGRHSTRADVLERLALLEPDPFIQLDIFAEAARVALEELSDAPRAVSNWRARLGLEPSDKTALDGLIIALERAGELRELVSALEDRASKSSDLSAARADRGRVAQIFATQLAEPAASIATWCRTRELHGRDDESFDALVQLYVGGGHWDELAAMLATEADASEPERAQQLRQQLGGLYVDRLNAPARAVEAFVAAQDYERAVQVAGEPRSDRALTRQVCRILLDLSTVAWLADGGVRESAAARAVAWAVDELGTRLREAAAYADVLDLLLTSAKLPFSRKERRAFERDAACLCSDQLGQPAQAIELFEQLFAEDATDDIAVASVSRLAVLLEEAGRFDAVITLWEGQATVRAAADDSSAAAALWARAGELAETWLSDIDRSLKDWRKAARLGLESGWEAMARLHTSRGEHAASAEVLSALCEVSGREQLGERALALAAAHVAAGQPAKARERLEWASERAMRVGALRTRLAELYREAELWVPLADLLTLEAARVAEPAARLAFLEQAAEVQLVRVGRPDAAVPLLEQAVALEPEERVRRLRLADALCLAQRHGEAIQVLKQQIERYGTRRPKERAMVHFAIAVAHLALGTKTEALEELLLASRIDPAHPGILQLQARLSLEAGELERAEKTFRSLLLVLGREVAGEHGPTRTEALLDLSEVAARRGDSLRAAESIESAFEVALENEFEAAALERGLRHRGHTELLVRALEDRLERVQDPSVAARVLADLTLLQAQVSGGIPAGAERLRERAQVIQTALEKTALGDDLAWNALGQVFDALGDDASESRILERRVRSWLDGSTPIDNPEPLYRLAAGRLLDAETRTEGFALLERALALRVDFERLLSTLLPCIELEQGAAEALDLLETAARLSSRNDWLLQVLELRLRHSGGSSQLFEEALGIAKELPSTEPLERLLQLGLEGPLVEHLGVEERARVELELAVLLEQRGDAAGAIERRERAAAGLPAEEARALLLSVAAQLADVLGDGERARRILTQLHRSNPADPEVYPSLLARLRELGLAVELDEVLARTIDALEAGPERSQMSAERARLLVASGDTGSAADLLADLLRDEPENAAAVLLLAEIYERSGRRAELAVLLTRQLDAARDRADADAIGQLGLRIAQLEEQTGNPAAALKAAEAVLAWQPEQPEALDVVARLADSLGQPDRAAEALESLLRTSTQPSPDLLERLVSLRETLGDSAGVESALRQALAVAPDSATLRERLCTLLEARGDFAASGVVLHEAIAREPDVSLVHRAISTFRHAEQLALAVSVIDEVALRGVTSVTLRRERGRILSELGRFPEALAELEAADAHTVEGASLLLEVVRAAARGADEALARELGLREVGLLEQLGDIEEALALLNGLDINYPGDLEILKHLVRLCELSGDQEGALSALSVLTESAFGPELVAYALEQTRLAELLGAPKRAQVAVERAILVAPDSLALRERLARIYRSGGDNLALGRLLLGDADRQTDLPIQKDLLLEAAQLLMVEGGDPVAAEAALERARAISPDDPEVGLLVARARLAAGRNDEAMQVLQELVAGQRGRRTRTLAKILEEMSRVQLDEGFLSDAMDSLSKAFDCDPKNGRLGMVLGRLALEIDEREQAHRAFGRVVMMKPSDADPNEGISVPERADANYFLAVIAKQQGDVRKAKVLLLKALSDNAAHEAARALSDELA